MELRQDLNENQLTPLLHQAKHSILKLKRLIMNKSLLTFLFTIFLSGCATVYMVPGSQSPSVINNFQGVLYMELGGLADIRPYMLRECQHYGGLNESSILKKTPPGAIATFNSIAGTYWSYKCNGTPQGTQTNSETNRNKVEAINNVKSETNSNIAIEDAKEKCSSLGFRVGTENFGECVLTLMK